MTGRIVRSADFERVLRMPPRAKSPHFALHHLRGGPSRFVRKAVSEATLHTASVPSAAELSTAGTVQVPPLVDDLAPAGISAPSATSDPALLALPLPASHDSPEACWLGTVVPKRHAKRSVTRSLLKRQMHAAFEREPGLPDGLWVVRLRAAFDVKQFPSAASDVLRRTVRQELDMMLSGLMRRLEASERSA